MSTLLVGFDSAWTWKNSGGLVGTIRQDNGKYLTLGPPEIASFCIAKNKILAWRTDHTPLRTIVLIDQPTIVANATGQRPVENLVSSPVSRRYGGMQPANTGRQGMFNAEAPIWPFLEKFGGPADFQSPTGSTVIFETYPVLTIIARGWTMSDPRRPKGRLPKYNPARRRTFDLNDWKYICRELSGFFAASGLDTITKWIDSIQDITPCKFDQDGLDACLCLLVAMELAEGKKCLLVGDQKTGYMVVSNSEIIHAELKERCLKTHLNPAQWIRSFVL